MSLLNPFVVPSPITEDDIDEPAASIVVSIAGSGVAVEVSDGPVALSADAPEAWRPDTTVATRRRVHGETNIV